MTIFGESAGSFSVSVLMASPLAQGLFQRAIGESGAFFGADAGIGAVCPSEERGPAICRFAGSAHPCRAAGKVRRGASRASLKQELLVLRTNGDGYFLRRVRPSILRPGNKVRCPAGRMERG